MPKSVEIERVEKRFRKNVKRRKNKRAFKKYSAVLSDREIRRAYKRGDIVISPYDESQVKPNSYDIRLGMHFYRQRRTQFLINMYDRNSPLWESEHQTAIPLKSMSCKYLTELLDLDAETARYVKRRGLENISSEECLIILRPGETILGHTEEFIGGVRGVTTMIKTRSSLGRNNIGICKCAGWGDTGFTNRWTLEITNFSQKHFVVLVVGRRIGQIVFMATGKVDQKYNSKYQDDESLEEMEANWEPSQMLPRLYLDEECVDSEDE